MTTIVDIGHEARLTILRQIGNMNVAAICGGRWLALSDGVNLPCGAGYRVLVRLDVASDTYTVERVYLRSGKYHSHGKVERVHCDELGEVAYRASCFRSYDAHTWMHHA